MSGAHGMTAAASAATAAWLGLEECEQALREAIEAADADAMERLAATRRQLIDEWVAAFPAGVDTATERAGLLRDLLTRNAALLALAEQQRRSSARDGAGLLQRQRAIDAYFSAGN